MTRAMLLCTFVTGVIALAALGAQGTPRPAAAPPAAPAARGDDMRLLRDEITRFLGLNLRLQIAFERSRAAQAALDRAAADCDAAQLRLAEASVIARQQAEVVASYQERLARALSDDERIDLQRELRIASDSLEGAVGVERGLSSRVDALSRALTRAQGELAAAQKDIAAIERAIVPPITDRKPGSN